jgi:hypothetical protein
MFFTVSAIPCCALEKHGNEGIAKAFFSLGVVRKFHLEIFFFYQESSRNFFIEQIPPILKYEILI